MQIFDSPSIEQIKILLADVSLPVEDLTEGPVGGERLFFGLGDNDVHGDHVRLTGIIGMEIFPTCALLRSLAVKKDVRTAGLGSMLIAHVELEVWRRDIPEIYLLTTDAMTYFERRGYISVARNDVPEDIRQTQEFSTLCPDSATVMVKRSS
jgi:amino-acid N-acetyltransferase